MAQRDNNRETSKNFEAENRNPVSGSRRRGSDETDAEAGRDFAQTHDNKGEAQNVNDDNGRTLSRQESDHARNKASEGERQNRGRNRNEDIY
jgi:hypothetical protein